MSESQRSFVPAAGHDWLLPFYDPLWRLLKERSTKGLLIEQAGPRPEHRVLDLGCGTGTLAVLLKQAEPRALVAGVDPDPKALAIATRKTSEAGLEVRFDRAFGDDLPYEDGVFDRVLSSFMFHHLQLDEKKATLAETRRVLAPGGSLHLVDFAPRPEGERGLIARLLHHDHSLEDNRGGRIPDLMREAGFEEAGEVTHRKSLLGNIGYFQATAPNA